ncbi:MAG: four helix bundle protein [Muribaculaceae bacterium]|nr:four helix bundle protein [Muribaculaceae bacterium]
MFSFEKLEVWQKSRELVRGIYVLLQSFPVHEQYTLCSQMRRSAISITSNLAEGCGRSSDKDRARFYDIAMGSLFELFAQLQLSCDFGYESDEQLATLRAECEVIGKMISGLKNALKKRMDR